MERIAGLTERRRTIIDAQAPVPRPHGWHWQLLHTRTRAVVNEGFAQQEVCPHLTSLIPGYHYAYTALYTRPA